jgi:hypothetical protein
LAAPERTGAEGERSHRLHLPAREWPPSAGLCEI